MVRVKKFKKKFFIIILLLLLIICYFLFKDKEYQITYQIDKSNITESYQNKTYQFSIKAENKTFKINFPNKRILKKRLINSLSIKKDDNTLCIIPKSKKLNFYPLCYENNVYISYHELKNKDILPSKYYPKISSQSQNYQQITINNLNNKTYYIWNYKGFYKISPDEQTTINFLKRDTYNIPISSQTNKGILIADYDQDYNFKTLYYLELKKNKIKKISNKKNISFDSYILGEYKDKVYLIDKKNKKEYEINTKNLSIQNIAHNNTGKILNNEKWEDISMNKLSNNEYSFSLNNFYNYQLIDQKLYLVWDEYNMLVSNNEVKDIIQIIDDTVYYLVGDKLYSFNPYDGETLIMSYFEWNFNYKNMIYIF